MCAIGPKDKARTLGPCVSLVPKAKLGHSDRVPHCVFIFDQGIPRRNHGILTREYPIVTMEFHQGILAWGGVPWKIKFYLNREYSVVTMEYSPENSRVGGGPLENKI